jgi:hypothetical protein
MTPGFDGDCIAAFQPEAVAGGQDVVVEVSVARQPGPTGLHGDPAGLGRDPTAHARQGEAAGFTQLGQGQGSERMRAHHQSPIARERFPVRCIMRGTAGLHQFFR